MLENCWKQKLIKHFFKVMNNSVLERLWKICDNTDTSNLETRFDTSNYEAKVPLPIGRSDLINER